MSSTILLSSFLLSGQACSGSHSVGRASYWIAMVQWRMSPYQGHHHSTSWERISFRTMSADSRDRYVVNLTSNTMLSMQEAQIRYYSSCSKKVLTQRRFGGICNPCWNWTGRARALVRLQNCPISSRYQISLGVLRVNSAVSIRCLRGLWQNIMNCFTHQSNSENAEPWSIRSEIQTSNFEPQLCFETFERNAVSPDWAPTSPVIKFCQCASQPIGMDTQPRQQSRLWWTISSVSLRDGQRRALRTCLT